MAQYFGDGGGGGKSPQARFLDEQARRNKGQNPSPTGTRAPTPTYRPPAPRPAPTPTVAAAPAAPAAPAYAPIAAPTVAAPAPAPAANAFPWLDAEFNKYFGAIQQDFADRGLLDSTNKMAPMKELADAMAGRYAQEARTDNQRSIENAMQLWNMLTSGALQQGQLALGAGLSPTLNMPAQPGIFSNIFNQAYLPPTKAQSGPTGDAPVVTRPIGVDAARGEVVPTYGMTYDNVKYRDDQAAAQRALAIQEAYLKMAQAEDARNASTQNQEGDPWNQMASLVRENRYLGKVEPGNNQNPTDLFESLEAQYNIDIEAEIRSGNQRAIALVQSAYDNPTISKAIIDRILAGGSWKKPGASKKKAGGDGGGNGSTWADRYASSFHDQPGYKGPAFDIGSAFRGLFDRSNPGPFGK